MAPSTRGPAEPAEKQKGRETGFEQKATRRTKADERQALVDDCQDLL